MTLYPSQCVLWVFHPSAGWTLYQRYNTREIAERTARALEETSSHYRLDRTVKILHPDQHPDRSEEELPKPAPRPKPRSPRRSRQQWRPG